jgi:hypothetical protein
MKFIFGLGLSSLVLLMGCLSAQSDIIRPSTLVPESNPISSTGISPKLFAVSGSGCKNAKLTVKTVGAKTILLTFPNLKVSGKDRQVACSLRWGLDRKMIVKSYSYKSSNASGNVILSSNGLTINKRKIEPNGQNKFVLENGFNNGLKLENGSLFGVNIGLINSTNSIATLTNFTLEIE